MEAVESVAKDATAAAETAVDATKAVSVEALGALAPAVDFLKERAGEAAHAAASTAASVDLSAVTETMSAIEPPDLTALGDMLSVYTPTWEEAAEVGAAVRHALSCPRPLARPACAGTPRPRL
jgi:hypothetical protein